MSLFPTQCLLFLLPMYPTYLFIVNILETWFRWCPPNPLANEVLLNLIRILSSKVIIHLDTVHIIPSPPNNHRERWKKMCFYPLPETKALAILVSKSLPILSSIHLYFCRTKSIAIRFYIEGSNCWRSSNLCSRAWIFMLFLPKKHFIPIAEDQGSFVIVI